MMNKDDGNLTESLVRDKQSHKTVRGSDQGISKREDFEERISGYYGDTSSPSEFDHKANPRQSLAQLAKPEFYKQDNWIYNAFEILFKLERRQTTIGAECWYGLLHFVSCLYCMAVIPQQMTNAGYDRTTNIVAVAACSGVGSIIGGLFSNLPFVLAPPTVVSIFLSVFLQQKELTPKEGNMAVVISGVVLILCGWRPLAQLCSRLIPVSIQVGTAVGIGLLTSLAGATEVGLVVTGQYTIVEMGPIHAKVIISIAGIIVICIANSYKLKGSFAIAVVMCSVVWWIDTSSWPTTIVEYPSFAKSAFDKDSYGANTITLVAEMTFLFVLYLNGLVQSLSDLAHLTRKDGSAPRGRWIYIMSGLFTVMGGLLTSAPILVSPESAAAIKAGAKTGLSAVVCGILFLISIFFAPLFDSVPAAGTSPVLIMIGVILFQNVNRIDWRNVQNAAPGFVTLFFIPMTYSIIQGTYSFLVLLLYM
jgi:AGZA family xanthine/uracil permease-like MFS transporter